MLTGAAGDKYVIGLATAFVTVVQLTEVEHTGISMGQVSRRVKVGS